MTTRLPVPSGQPILLSEADVRIRTVLLGVIALLVVGVAAAFLILGQTPPPPAARAAQPQGTVLLIPGYGGGAGELGRLEAELSERGIRAEVVDIGDGTGDLRTYAADIDDRARTLMAAGQPAPDLVGFSAGGIIARIAADGAPDLYRKVVTLGSPHNGTATADAGALFGECPMACQQMRTDSALLAELPVAKYPGDWLSVWSDTDSVIRPPDSSELTGVRGYRLQEFCPGTVEHGSIPGDPRTTAVVTAFLTGATLPTTCP